MSDKCVFFIKYVGVKVKVCFVEFGGTSGTLNEKSRGGLMVNVVRREVPRPNPRDRRSKGFGRRYHGECCAQVPRPQGPKAKPEGPQAPRVLAAGPREAQHSS